MANVTPPSTNPPTPSLNQLLGGSGSLTSPGLPSSPAGYKPPVYGQYDNLTPPAGDTPVDPNLLAALEQAIYEEAAIAGVQVTQQDVQQWATTAASDPNLTQLYPDINNGTLSLSSFITYARDFIRQQYIPAISSSKTSQEYAQYGITDRTQETIYSPIRSLWEQYFGREPTTAQLQDVIAHGGNINQWTDYVRSLPSHIQGYTIGQYTDTRQIADGISQNIYGHPSNDTIMQDLLANHAGSKADIQSYYDAFDFQPGKNVNPQAYNRAYAANAPIAAGLTNDYPHPLAIKQQLQSLGDLNELSPSEQPAETLPLKSSG